MTTSSSIREFKNQNHNLIYRLLSFLNSDNSFTIIPDFKKSGKIMSFLPNEPTGCIKNLSFLLEDSTGIQIISVVSSGRTDRFTKKSVVSSGRNDRFGKCRFSFSAYSMSYIHQNRLISYPNNHIN